jgi:hypothetical protein
MKDWAELNRVLPNFKIYRDNIEKFLVDNELSELP